MTRVAVDGVTITELARSPTVTVAVPATPSNVADTVVAPSLTAVTRPVLDTVATAASAELQVWVPPDTVPPLARVALPVSCTVSPTQVSVALPGETATDATASVRVVGVSVFEQAPTIPHKIKARTDRRVRYGGRALSMLLDGESESAGVWTGGASTSACSNSVERPPCKCVPWIGSGATVAF